MCTDLLHLLFTNLTPWLTVISSFGALGSAIAALFALRHMKKQTQSSYKPDLYLTFYNSNYINYYVNEYSFQFTINIDDKTVETNDLIYTIENIGFGAAKDIQIDWEFDFDKAISTIKNKLKGIITVERIKHLVHFNIIEPKKPIPFIIDPFERTKYDFVLPRKDEKFNKSPSVPDSITTLFRTYFMLKEQLYHPPKGLPYISNHDFKDFPEVTAKISYLDIGGNSHTKTFKASFFISIYSDKVSKDKLQFHLYPEFEVVN